MQTGPLTTATVTEEVWGEYVLAVCKPGSEKSLI